MNTAVNVDSAFGDLIDAIDGVTVLPAYRANEDRLINEEDGPNFVVVSFIPTGRREVLSIDNYIGDRENKNYKNYGYLDIYKVIYRTICSTSAAASTHSTSIESYLKVNFNTINSNIVIRRHTFSGQRPFAISNVERIFGVEVSFEVSVSNIWDDEPEEGAVSQTPVEVIDIPTINEKNIKIRVRYG